MSSSSANRFERHGKLTFFVLVVVVLLLAEGAARVLAQRGLLPYRRYSTSAEPVFWNDINPHFGVWHYPNTQFEHRTACFQVRYETNSHGARDVERQLAMRDDSRVAVLGDSFVEGWGVPRRDRLTDIVERETGIEHLNFGTGGGFGSIQQWLLYETLAQRFEHTAVFVFMLPDNDFADNRPPESPGRRYRPYLRKVGDDYELYYSTEFRPEGIPRDRPRLWRLRRGFYNTFYIANALRQASRVKPAEVRDRIPYDDFTESDAQVLLHTYRELARAASPRPVKIFIVPRLRDLQAHDDLGYDFRVVRLLRDFAASEKTVDVIDLMPHFVREACDNGREYDEFFFPCDGHWNAGGHRVAARAVMDEIYRAKDLHGDARWAPGPARHLAQP